MKQIYLFTIFLGSFFCNSCLTVGNNFLTDVKWIIEKKTTLKEIDLKLGKPFRTGYDTGLYTYTYAYYRYSILKPVRTKDLVIRFNTDGTVANYTFSSSFDEDKEILKPKN